MQGYGSRLIEVFVLDDHDIVRRGLLDLLTKRDIIIIGEAGSATQAIPRILELRPDVMLLDVQLPDGSGVQVCRDVRAVDPSIRGLLLTSAGDQEALALSALAGAAGAVVKLAGTSNIIDAVRRVAAGRPLLNQVETERVNKHLLARAADLDPPPTPPQTETLAMVLAGHTDQQIADEQQQPLAQVREEVSQFIASLTTYSANRDRPGRHRRNP